MKRYRHPAYRPRSPTKKEIAFALDIIPEDTPKLKEKPRYGKHHTKRKAKSTT